MASEHWTAEQDAEFTAAVDRPRLLIPASKVKSRSIRWAWTGRLPIGYMTVQTGIEGLGKSVFAAWMIAQLTRGKLDGEWRGQPVHTIVVAGEDGIEDTWKPRLDLAAADLNYVSFLNLNELPGWNLRDGIGVLDEAAEQVTARVLFIDAALDHMPEPKSGESINSATFVRQSFEPLRTLTRRREMVTDFSMHPPKARGSDFRDLIQASQAFSAMPRCGLMFAYHPEDDPDDPQCRRVFLRGKGNLGRNPGALEFRVVGRLYEHDSGEIQEREMVTDVSPSEVTMADLAPSRTVGARKETKAERAEEIIRAALADGDWHPAAPIRERLAGEKLDSGSVRAPAMRRAGVETDQLDGLHGGWSWRVRRHASDNGTDSDPSRGSSDDKTDSGTLRPPARARSTSETDSEAETPVRTVRVPESGSDEIELSGGVRVRQSGSTRAPAREAAAAKDDA